MLNLIKGRGLRERVLRAFSAGDLYDRLAQLELERGRLLAEACREAEEATRRAAEKARLAEARRQAAEEKARLAEARRQAAEEKARLAEARRQAAEQVAEQAGAARRYLDAMSSANRLVEIDYSARPRVRYGWDLPPHPQLQRILSSGEDRYRITLRSFLPLLDTICRVAPHAKIGGGEPHWLNDWFPAFDAISLYGLVATRRPRRLVEIGSGNSTLFARRAVRDHSPGTRIVSIDPSPRAEVDAQCDEVVRMPLEDVPLSFFEGITPADMVFFDGSHRAFQNSDATVFFTEILPLLPAGTLVGVHDIFLPYDYPQAWLGRWYSEQYLLACWLLGGRRLYVELPVEHCSHVPALHSVLAPFWAHPSLAGAGHFGGAFWFSVAERP
jgi:Methyltransferase domain